MAYLFNGKRVLVTGGSSGIGLAIAREMFEGGAHVTVLARDPVRLEKASRFLEKCRLSPGQDLSTLSIDLKESTAAIPVIQKYIAEHGAFDWLINAAGAAHPGTFEEMHLDTFRWMMEANYFTHLNTIKAVLPCMLAQGSGTIVNFSSVAGFMGVYGYSAYGAAKYAVRGLSDVLRAELKPRGIQVSIVFPPDTLTPQLEYENKFKPAVTKHLSGGAKPMQAQEVARFTLKQALRGRYIIIPGSESPWFFRAVNLLGSLSYPVMDLLVRDALRKASK